MSTKFLSGLSWLRIEGGAGGCVKKGTTNTKEITKCYFSYLLRYEFCAKKSDKTSQLNNHVPPPFYVNTEKTIQQIVNRRLKI